MGLGELINDRHAAAVLNLRVVARNSKIRIERERVESARLRVRILDGVVLSPKWRCPPPAQQPRRPLL